jgi:hypothetical protein
MEGNFQQRIRLTGDRERESGGLFQAVKINAKIFEAVSEAGVEDQVRALAHRGCGQEGKRRQGVGMHRRDQ